MAYMVSERELDEHSRWIGFRGTRVRVPDPSLHLVMNIGHEMIHDAALYSGMTELRYLLELRELVETKHAEIDWSWVRGKFGHRSFRLAMEAQDRMARDLLGARLFDDLDDTTVGYWLHRRRIVKSRFELAGRIEWSFVRRLLAIGDVPGA